MIRISYWIMICVTNWISLNPGFTCLIKSIDCSKWFIEISIFMWISVISIKFLYSEIYSYIKYVYYVCMHVFRYAFSALFSHTFWRESVSAVRSVCGQSNLRDSWAATCAVCLLGFQYLTNFKFHKRFQA